LQRDVFDLPKEFPAYFDYVVEHTCFYAILPEQRSDYVQVVRSILKPQGELIALFWAHQRQGGPPFGTTPDELRNLFSPHFNTQRLSPVGNSVESRQDEEYFARFVALA
jgi:cyclopropane fatty-acyl-phospholipid synthase-like methyltransferase